MELALEPFLNLPPLTYSQVNNEITALNLVMTMFREVHFHTGQIIYAAIIRKRAACLELRLTEHMAESVQLTRMIFPNLKGA